jgi:hypothetical protein
MARKVSFKETIVGNYTSAHIMQLLRSAKQRSEQKGVAFGGLDPLFQEVMNQLHKGGFRCPCCRNEYQRKADGNGGGGKRSLSVHRIIASMGYVPENVSVLCQSCNNAIGETNTFSDIMSRVKALRWQANLMRKTAKKLLDASLLVE